MFSRKSPRGTQARPPRGQGQGLSFIGPEVIVDGDIATSEQLHIEVRINGDVRCASLCQ